MLQQLDCDHGFVVVNVHLGLCLRMENQIGLHGSSWTSSTSLQDGAGLRKVPRGRRLLLISEMISYTDTHTHGQLYRTAPAATPRGIIIIQVTAVKNASCRFLAHSNSPETRLSRKTASERLEVPMSSSCCCAGSRTQLVVNGSHEP